MTKAIRPEECTEAAKILEKEINEKVEEINKILQEKYMPGLSVTMDYYVFGKGVAGMHARKRFEEAGWEVKQTWDQRDHSGWTTFKAKNEK